eukprot:2787931-Alexandrium_andersonii.AAC.1
MHDLDEAPFLPKVTSEEGTDPQDRAEAMLSQIRDDLSSQSSESLVRAVSYTHLRAHETSAHL